MQLIFKLQCLLYYSILAMLAPKRFVISLTVTILLITIPKGSCAYVKGEIGASPSHTADVELHAMVG